MKRSKYLHASAVDIQESWTESNAVFFSCWLTHSCSVLPLWAAKLLHSLWLRFLFKGVSVVVITEEQAPLFLPPGFTSIVLGSSQHIVVTGHRYSKSYLFAFIHASFFTVIDMKGRYKVNIKWIWCNFQLLLIKKTVFAYLHAFDWHIIVKSIREVKFCLLIACTMCSIVATSFSLTEKALHDGMQGRALVNVKYEDKVSAKYQGPIIGLWLLS